MGIETRFEPVARKIQQDCNFLVIWGLKLKYQLIFPNVYVLQLPRYMGIETLIHSQGGFQHIPRLQLPRYMGIETM